MLDEGRRIVTAILPSSNREVQVGVLGLFELAGLEIVDPGVYTFPQLMANGKVLNIPYDIETLSEIPEPPPTPWDVLIENSPEWYALHDWVIYLGYQAHALKRLHAAVEYYRSVCLYILDHCLDEIVKTMLLEPEDWRAVLLAALVPKVKIQDLHRTMTEVYGATFDGMTIFEAMRLVRSRGHSEYRMLVYWEAEAMDTMGFTEEQWLAMEFTERVRKVSHIALKQLLTTLDYDAHERDKAPKNQERSASSDSDIPDHAGGATTPAREAGRTARR